MMWAKLLLNKWVGLALLLSALAFMTYLYKNESEARELENKAYELQLDKANAETRAAAATAENNAAQVKILESDLKRFEQAAKDAYQAAEIARLDAKSLRDWVAHYDKASPAFAHCLDLAMPDELQLLYPGSRNRNKNRNGKSATTGNTANAVRKPAE